MLADGCGATSVGETAGADGGGSVEYRRHSQWWNGTTSDHPGDRMAMSTGCMLKCFIREVRLHTLAGAERFPSRAVRARPRGRRRGCPVGLHCGLYDLSDALRRGFHVPVADMGVAQGHLRVRVS